MKLQAKSIEKFLKNGGNDIDVNNDDADLELTEIDNDFEEEFNSQKRVKPMRSAITKNKKEDANMYRNIDPKRFHKKK